MHGSLSTAAECEQWQLYLAAEPGTEPGGSVGVAGVRGAAGVIVISCAAALRPPGRHTVHVFAACEDGWLPHKCPPSGMLTPPAGCCKVGLWTACRNDPCLQSKAKNHFNIRSSLIIRSSPSFHLVDCQGERRLGAGPHHRLQGPVAGGEAAAGLRRHRSQLLQRVLQHLRLCAIALPNTLQSYE